MFTGTYILQLLLLSADDLLFLFYYLLFNFCSSITDLVWNGTGWLIIFEILFRVQAPAVQRADNFIHWISRYPAEQMYSN